MAVSSSEREKSMSFLSIGVILVGGGGVILSHTEGTHQIVT